MNEASRYLLALATRHAETYATLPETRAILVTGSVAAGESDFYSDIDMIVYCDQLPSKEALQTVREQTGGQQARFLGEGSEADCLEIYSVQGVECQIVHTTIAAWEREMATVLEELDTTSPTQKALSGLVEGRPLYGEALIRDWQAKVAAYPDALAKAMIERNLQIFPIWMIQDRFAPRDATLWLHQIFVETEQNLLGILAGLNRLYYSPFQFKRLRHFTAKMTHAPADLAERLDRIFHTEATDAIRELESLVAETLTLVEAQMPEVDTSAVRSLLGRRLPAWKPMPVE